MNIPGNECLRRQTTGHGDPIDIKPFIPIKSELSGDEMRIVYNAKTRERDSKIFKLWTLRTTRHNPKRQQKKGREDRPSDFYNGHSGCCITFRVLKRKAR